MKKLSKIHMKQTFFISTNFFSLIFLYKIANAMPNPFFSKPSTIQLLSEALKNPAESFIQRLSNGNLRANFLHSGRTGHSLRNFNVRSGAYIGVKETSSSDYKTLLSTKTNKRITGNGIAFKIYSDSKNNFRKEIDIFEQNGKIIINSKKAVGTPNYIFKSTTLDFGDGASTSSQASSSSNQPTIISTRYSDYNLSTKDFNVEETTTYNPLNLKILSQTSKNKLTGQVKSFIAENNDNTPLKIDRGNFYKSSTARLLSETVMDPNKASITKTSDENLKVKFLYWGGNSVSCNNFNIRVNSTVKVKKTPDANFEKIEQMKGKKQLIGEGNSFNVITRSKYGLGKEINITSENGNIIVNSVKGVGTPFHVVKKTILDYDDVSSSPKIIVTRDSLSSNQATEFDVRKTATYDAAKFKLLSQITTNKSNGQTEHVTTNPDDTKTKIIKHSNGKTEKFILTHFDDPIYSELVDDDGNTLITRQISNDLLSFQKISQNGKLIEESMSAPNQYESRHYDQDGKLILTTRSNTLSGGESIGTINYANGSSITQERRGNGNLKTTITQTSVGELFKQDFNENGEPINNPYKIN